MGDKKNKTVYSDLVKCLQALMEKQAAIIAETVLQGLNVCMGEQSIQEVSREQELEKLLQDEKEKNRGLQSKLESIVVQNDHMQKELNLVREESNKYSRNLEELTEESSKKYQEYEEQLRSSRLESTRLKDKYEEIEQVLKKYHKLPNDVKKGMHNILQDPSVYSLVGACNRWSDFYGLAKYYINEAKFSYEEEQTIRDFLCFFVNGYDKMCGQQKYELIIPKKGEKYDSDQHSISGKKTDGIISEVRLPGIKVDDTIKERAIVRLK